MSEPVNVREDGPVPLKLTRNAYLNGSLVGPPLIVSVSVETARDLIARGFAEAVPGNTDRHLPELRTQPSREPVAHKGSPSLVEPETEASPTVADPLRVVGYRAGDEPSKPKKRR